MSVFIFNQNAKIKPGLSGIKKKTGSLVRLMGCAKKRLDITFTDDKKISVLNNKFMNKRGATDVLSFPLDDKKFLGDLVISLDMAKKQAGLLGLSFRDHLLFLVIHGLLHLTGFDHQYKKQKEEMIKQEKFLSQKIGLRLPKTLWDL